MTERMTSDDRPIGADTVQSVDPQWVCLASLEVSVSPMDAEQTVRWIQERRGQKHLLLNHNLHSVYLYQHNAVLRDLYGRASAVVIDGAPVLALARRETRTPLSAGMRIGSTDWIAEMGRVDPDLRVFVFGAKPESNSAAVDELRRIMPRAVVAGTDGYVDRQAAVEAIRAFGPDLVLVGLGMPVQEEFLSTFFAALPPAIYATVGGAIDYVAGANQLAPRWIGALGLEWFWRLVHEPRRLWRRYLWEPLLLAGTVTKRRLSHRASRADASIRSNTEGETNAA